MAAKWKREGSSGQRLASRLGACKHSDESGGITFGGPDFWDCSASLFSFIEFRPEIPEGEKLRIFNQALFAAARKGAIELESILKQVKELEVEFIMQPKTRYVISTSLSIQPREQMKRCKVDNIIISFGRKISKAYTEDAEAEEMIEEMACRPLCTDPPKTYLPVLLFLSARSPEEAFHKGFEALDLLRGIWNLNENYGLFRITIGDVRTPINTIVLGPIHIVQPGTANPLKESWWYDPYYQGPITVKTIGPQMEDFYRREKRVRKLLQMHNYRADLEWAIREYGRALDYRNFDISFLKLWPVMERLTDTLIGNYGVTIRRTSFIFQEPQYHREVLDHLRMRRNAFVHYNELSRSIDTYIFQLKFYVEALINFHLANGKTFSNLSEASEFLDLPVDLKALKKKSHLYTRGIRFRSK